MTQDNKATDLTATEQNISSEDDYKLIEDALLQNPRGRWFLDQYINRNRPEDTQRLLSAIERIENNLTAKPAAIEASDPIRLSIMEMSKAIAKTRDEINSIKPQDVQDDQIINATEELSAIVESTENATNIILEAAEEIQEAAWILREAGAENAPCDNIDEKTTEIYTACSFQDITGQRTTKVVQALCYIENRINAMIDIWDIDINNTNSGPIKDGAEQRPDSHLLNGPALNNEGVQQNTVDDILTENNPAEKITAEEALASLDDMSFDAIQTSEADTADLASMDFDSPEAATNPDEISFDAIETESELPELPIDELPETELNEPEIDPPEVQLDEVGETSLENQDLDLPDEMSASEFQPADSTEQGAEAFEAETFETETSEPETSEVETGEAETFSADILETAAQEQTATEQVVSFDEQTAITDNSNNVDGSDSIIDLTETSTIEAAAIESNDMDRLIEESHQSGEIQPINPMDEIDNFNQEATEAETDGNSPSTNIEPLNPLADEMPPVSPVDETDTDMISEASPVAETDAIPEMHAEPELHAEIEQHDSQEDAAEQQYNANLEDRIAALSETIENQEEQPATSDDSTIDELLSSELSETEISAELNSPEQDPNIISQEELDQIDNVELDDLTDIEEEVLFN